MRVWSPHFTRTKQPHTADRRDDSAWLRTEQVALAPHAVEAAKEGRAPCAHGKDGSEEDDGIDADAALARPIGVWLEVEPEGELVECERGADAVADGHQPAEKDGERRVGSAEVEQPAVADEQQNQDSPDKVMDVAAAHDDPVERAVVMDDEADEQSRAQEGEEERNRGDEHAAAGTVWDGGANEKAQARELQEDEQHDDDQAGEGQKQECSSSGHILLNHPGVSTGREKSGLIDKI